jgi:hypothetical protein
MQAAEAAPDYRKFYDLERYLFESVHRVYHEQGWISAFDFFCIVIWKANRAKSKVARRLLDRATPSESLDGIVKRLTAELRRCTTAKERLHHLVKDWGFRLPMATAILTVLYPADFTVYDERVCTVLGKHRDLVQKVNFESIWEGYQTFRRDVDSAAPVGLSLRDKDRYLWGKSFHDGLIRDITQGFGDADAPGE